MGALCHSSFILIGYLYLGGRYIARFVVKNRLLDNMCYDESGLCAHNYFNNHWRFNCHHSEDDQYDHLMRSSLGPPTTFTSQLRF